MLNPNNDRLDYGQVLSPPFGYKLDFAVGTTYSLDLDTLVGASIALGLSAETDSNLMKNPICLLEALRATCNKVALFCEAGQIHTPSNISSLYILLEKMVFQVTTAKGKGITKYPSFHPKFWLMRYTDKSNTPLYRVVVLSRNLTSDRSWDITFCMDGKVNEIETDKTTPVIDFMSYLINKLSTDENGKLKKNKIRAIMRELPYVHFELNSQEFEDFEFLPVGVKDNNGGFHSVKDKPFNPLFRDTFHEILIMSPFLTSSVIKNFNNRIAYINKTNCMLFTRAMSLGKLKPADCSNFRIFTMKDAVIDGESAISESEHQIQKQDIHAKVLMVRKNADSYLYLGSLNASNNAIEGNVELMIMLKSKNRYLNLSRLSESLFGGSEDNPSNPFQEVLLTDTVTVDEEQEKQNLLDNYIKEVNRMNPQAKVVENGDNYDLNVTFVKYEEIKYNVKLSPLLSNKTEELSENILFSSLSLEQLSDFYKISVSNGERTVQRIIIIQTTGLPKDREKAVISATVKDKDCFYRYISFLLGDSYVLSALESNNNTSESIGTTNIHKSVQIPALYEKMLQTAATAPERFKEIDYLIKAISSDGIVPKQFEELYNTFKKVVKL